MERLSLSNLPQTFRHFELYRIPAIPDGSCLIHAILRGSYVPYIMFGPDEKKTYVKEIREILATRLTQKPNGSDKTNYQFLAGGVIDELGKQDPRYSAEHMQKVLQSSECLGQEFIEYISLAFKLDIYILDVKTQEVVPQVFTKQRDSIVLLYDANMIHYDLVSLRDKNGNYETLFTPTHSLIRAFNQRINDLKSD